MTRNNEFITRGGQRYDAPAVAVVDIHNEGVLCGSYDAANYGYDYENDLGEI